MTTTSQSLEQAYFAWLYEQVRPQHSSKSYEELCWVLYKKEFVPVIFNDDNRVQDGYDLVVEFFREQGLAGDSARIEGEGCSCLELVIGLSRRLEWNAGGTALMWAWTLLGNLGFHSLPDPLSELNRRYIDEVLERIIWRIYRADGVGGLFPLQYPQEDQRKVELWYQMSAYIEENPIE